LPLSQKCDKFHCLKLVIVEIPSLQNFPVQHVTAFSLAAIPAQPAVVKTRTTKRYVILLQFRL